MRGREGARVHSAKTGAAEVLQVPRNLASWAWYLGPWNSGPYLPALGLDTEEGAQRG